MSGKQIVQPVEDNFEKRDTFRYLKGRYKMAMKNAFYLEATMIVYALLEDRLKALIYYTGAIDGRKSYKITGSSKRRPQIKKLVAQYGEKGENPNLGISSITGKMTIVKAFTLWSMSEELSDDCYLEIIRKQYRNRVKQEELLKALGDIKDFCNYRNEIVHAAFNKNIISISEGIREEIEKAMEAEKVVEAQVSALKRTNKIRLQMGLRES